MKKFGKCEFLVDPGQFISCKRKATRLFQWHTKSHGFMIKVKCCQQHYEKLLILQRKYENAQRETGR